MDFGFTFFEASVLVHAADLLEKTLYFRIVFDFARNEPRATDGCFDCTKLRTVPRIACALHSLECSLARDGH